MNRQTIPLLLVAVTFFVGTGCFRVSTETRILRDAVIDNTPKATWDEQIEIGLGRFTFGLAQLGTVMAGQFVDLPTEARIVLNSAKEAETSVFHLESGSKDHDAALIMAKADEKMLKKGWYRLVGVLQDHQLVAIYVPEKGDGSSEANVCVIVLDGRDLVCVRARANLRPLFKLAMEKAGDTLPPRT